MRRSLSACGIAALVLVARDRRERDGRVGGTRRPTAVTVALVSDIGKFNDRGFNQNQLAGLKRGEDEARASRRSPMQSNSVSDYIPNMTSAVRAKADLVIAAGFLLADATATMAKKFPDTHFAITDYPVRRRRSPTRRASRSSRTSRA